MKLGLVTYNLARNWDIPTIIANCTEAGFEGVELRTEHAHGVELSLSKAEREDVRKQFADSVVKLVSLGSTYEYHSDDPAVLREMIEGSKEYAQLAADVGATGIKVRPNGTQTEKGIPLERTLEQIGVSLREVGEAAAHLGIQVRVEVHGRVTSEPKNMRTILDAADHPNVKACWNSNATDRLEDGTIGANFDLLKNDIGGTIHITDLANPEYPWRELFAGLKSIGYDGYTLAEIGQESCEPVRFMKYYRALWLELQRD